MKKNMKKKLNQYSVSKLIALNCLARPPNTNHFVGFDAIVSRKFRSIDILIEKVQLRYLQFHHRNSSDPPHQLHINSSAVLSSARNCKISK